MYYFYLFLLEEAALKQVLSRYWEWSLHDLFFHSCYLSGTMVGARIQVHLNQWYFISSVSQCWFVKCLLSAHNKKHTDIESECKQVNFYPYLDPDW